MRIDPEIYLHPITKKKLKYDNTHFIDQSGKHCAEIFADQQRIDWISCNSYPTLNSRVLREINKYDSWALKQNMPEMTSIDRNTFDINNEQIYIKNKNFKALDIDLHELMNGKKILDIGGSCIDAWRFLATGAKEVHHIEVSKASQILGLKRIKKLLGNDVDSGKVVFHTSPAEFLPFTSGLFDVVFSRSSIHHTLRSYSVEEIARVLKTGGCLLCFEPIQNTFVNSLMHLSRKLRKVDRGTDNPLTRKDLKLFKSHFSHMIWQPRHALWNNFKVAINWFNKSKPIDVSVPVLYGVK